MMAARTGLAACLAATLWVAEAPACGYCIEDRMASVYDHAVLVQAGAAGHKVAYYALLGPASADAAAGQAVARHVEALRGVVRGSVRYSGALAALSFAYDPRIAGAGGIDAALARALAKHGMTAGLVTVADHPSQVRPGRRAPLAGR